MKFPIRIFKVSDHSMEPALNGGDYVFVWCPRTRLRNGDIVVLPHPSKGMAIVKRIDRISGNSYFLVGDSRETSEDSRNFGAVSGRDIIGKVVMKI